MAIRWTSIMAAVYVVDSDGAGHLRKITVSGTPRVDNIALSSDIAYGSLALVSVGTMLLCTSVISNVRVVALPNGNACSGGCTSATVVASSIGAYSGALGHQSRLCTRHDDYASTKVAVHKCCVSENTYSSIRSNYQKKQHNNKRIYRPRPDGEKEER